MKSIKMIVKIDLTEQFVWIETIEWFVIVGLLKLPESLNSE